MISLKLLSNKNGTWSLIRAIIISIIPEKIIIIFVAPIAFIAPIVSISSIIFAIFILNHFFDNGVVYPFILALSIPESSFHYKISKS